MPERKKRANLTLLFFCFLKNRHMSSHRIINAHNLLLHFTILLVPYCEFACADTYNLFTRVMLQSTYTLYAIQNTYSLCTLVNKMNIYNLRSNRRHTCTFVPFCKLFVEKLLWRLAENLMCKASRNASNSEQSDFIIFAKFDIHKLQCKYSILIRYKLLTPDTIHSKGTMRTFSCRF